MNVNGRCSAGRDSEAEWDGERSAGLLNGKSESMRTRAMAIGVYDYLLPPILRPADRAAVLGTRTGERRSPLRSPAAPEN